MLWCLDIWLGQCPTDHSSDLQTSEGASFCAERARPVGVHGSAHVVGHFCFVFDFCFLFFSFEFIVISCLECLNTTSHHKKQNNKTNLFVCLFHSSLLFSYLRCLIAA